MKILVFSDSHGNFEKMKQIVNLYGSTVNYIIHLGDLVRDAKNLQAEFKSPSCEVEYVYGNCDFSIDKSRCEKEIVLCGKRIFMLHGHMHNVKLSVAMLKSIAEQRQYDIVLYGHTHIAKSEYFNGAYIINPGSIGKPRDGKPSYAVINISDGTIRVDICRVKY